MGYGFGEPFHSLGPAQVQAQGTNLINEGGWNV